ncbi:MAG: hypothetical protein U1E17_01000 [Geminicoccaceae bacterium]
MTAHPEVGRFFEALGSFVSQGYMANEGTGARPASTPGRSRIDTVGPPLREVEVKIAEDGEIPARAA